MKVSLLKVLFETFSFNTMKLALFSLQKHFWFYSSKNFASMAKWKHSWLEAEDSNSVRLNLWLQKDDEYHGADKLCSFQVKYFTQGVQAFTQQSQKKKHKQTSYIRFSNSQVHISGKVESSLSTEVKKPILKTMILDASQKDKFCRGYVDV